MTTSHHTTPPDYIAEALHGKLGAFTHGAAYRLEMVHFAEVAEAVWAALLEHGQTAVTRETRLYPDDGTYAGQRVLVVPLANPNADA